MSKDIINAVVGIDVGGTNFRIGAVTAENIVYSFRKVPVSSIFKSEDSLKDFGEYLINDYFFELKEKGINPIALSAGIPATIDKERKRILQSPNIPFQNVDFVDVLTDKLGIPVFMDKDAVMALSFDKEKYKIPDCEVLLGIYVGTGIANVVQIDGKYLTGKHGTACELSHIPVDGSEFVCGCGNTGCMENVGGGKYLAYLCREVFTDTDISKIFIEKKEDPLLNQYVDRVAQAITAELNIFDPDYLLLGGGVLAMEGFPKAYLIERIHSRTRKPFPERDLENTMIFTADEKDKSVIGAAILARKRMGEML